MSLRSLLRISSRLLPLRCVTVKNRVIPIRFCNFAFAATLSGVLLGSKVDCAEEGNGSEESPNSSGAPPPPAVDSSEKDVIATALMNLQPIVSQLGFGGLMGVLSGKS